jgi:GT2 family glycosyltransferase
MALDRFVDLPRLGLLHRKPNVITLADRARDAGEWELAAQLYREILDRNPGNPPIWVQYGHALKESGRLRDPRKLVQAERAYRRSLSLGPGVADTYLQLGHVLKLQGKSEEAQAAYLRAFALDPEMPYTLQELAGLGCSENWIAELVALIKKQKSDTSAPTGANGPKDQPIVLGNGRRLTAASRRYIAEHFLGIDLDWTTRRHRAMVHPPFAEAAQAAADVRRRLLQQAGVDFSPFVSVKRLSDQHPDYDFSSGEALVDVIEGHLPTLERVSLHWLFDEKLYDGMYPELHDRKRIRYFEFLLSGAGQSRRPHRLFNPAWYTRRHRTAGDNPGFFHFLRMGIFDDLSPSPLFDPEFYRAMYPQVSADITNGTYSCSLEHFVIEGADQGLLPSADWDPEYYLANNLDVVKGVASGLYRSGFDHWLNYGISENRAPNAQYDPLYYIDNYPSVVEEIKRYDLLGPFEHFATFGRQRRWRARAPLHTIAVPIEHAKALYLKRCELSVFRVHTRGVIRFVSEAQPFFSVVISAYNNFAHNIRVLELLEHAAHYTRSKLGVGIEVVVVDNGSSDETVRLEDYAQGVVFRSVSPNIGFPRACNLGASLASGTYLVFLNNDVEFEADVFVRLHEAVQADKTEVACFGAAILQFDGSIQDLGSGIWRDGVAQGYFRNEPMARYAFAYPRDVDYVAGCFFCISANEFRSYGGFDERYSPGYYEESDLSLRLWKAGRRSRAYPDIRIYHLEFGAFSSGTTAWASTALMARNRLLFASEHRDLLERRPRFGPNAGYSAQYRGVRPRLLFIEDRVPSLRLGSGYGRSEIVVRSLLDVADIDIFACYRDDSDLVPADFHYIEIIYGHESERLKTLLSSRHYDAVYVCRAHNLSSYRGVLNGWKEGGGKVVFDTEAIDAIREIARLEGAESYADITGSTRFPMLLEEELRFADLADIIVAVNEFEAEIVRQRLDRPVYTIGHHLAARPVDTGLDERSGLLFVGALHDMRSPNYDSLTWYLDHVWPRIRAVRPEETLRIAGYVRVGVPVDSLRRNGVILLGPVPDLTSEYARARVFIAPTRFAGGIPFKVQEALSHGVPVVCSMLIHDQLRHTGDLVGVGVAATVTDDGQAFADRCLTLLADDEFWRAEHQRAITYVRRTCAPSSLTATVRELIDELINLAYGKKVTVSAIDCEHIGANAVDGNRTTYWSAGGLPPQWIEIDLGQPYDIKAVRLITSQDPAGPTTHEVYGKGPGANGDWRLLHRFEGSTVDGEALEKRWPQPLGGIEWIKVVTTKSPSWVGWREIEIFGNEPAP